MICSIEPLWLKHCETSGSGYSFWHCNSWFIFDFSKILTAAQQALNTIRLVCTHGNFRGSEIRFEIKVLLLLQHRTPFPNCNVLRLVSSQVTARQPGWTSAAIPSEGRAKAHGAFASGSNCLTSQSSLICCSSVDWVTFTFVKGSLFQTLIIYIFGLFNTWTKILLAQQSPVEFLDSWISARLHCWKSGCQSAWSYSSALHQTLQLGQIHKGTQKRGAERCAVQRHFIHFTHQSGRS